MNDRCKKKNTAYVVKVEKVFLVMRPIDSCSVVKLVSLLSASCDMFVDKRRHTHKKKSKENGNGIKRLKRRISCLCVCVCTARE